MVPDRRPTRGWRAYVAGGGLVLAAAHAAAGPADTSLQPPTQGALDAGGNNQPKGQSKDPQPEYAKKEAKPLTTSENDFGSRETQNERKDARTERKERAAHETWEIAWVAVGSISTAILTLATIALGAFTYLLWRETRKAVTDGRDSANHAETSAKAATDALALTEQTSKTTQRAFVTLDWFGLVPYPTQSDIAPFTSRWKVTVIWKNYGQTPTKWGRNYVSWNRFDTISPDMIMDDVVGAGPSSPVLIAPGATIEGERHLIRSDLFGPQNLLGGKILIWGWFEYNDVFTNTPRHRTEFCRLLEIDGRADLNNCGMSTLVYGKHNGADEECQHKPKTRSAPA